jgi:oxalate decarboxylase/phosphoglucose isomerase-like protein (cupin superfamily)
MTDPKYLNAEHPFYLEYSVIDDQRGRLTSVDFSELPFQVNRYFAISVKSTDFTRGKHSHKLCWQAFFASKGSQRIVVKNLNGVRVFDLEAGKLLVVPPYNWCEVSFDSNDSIMGVFASHPYDYEDYLFVEPPL